MTDKTIKSSKGRCLCQSLEQMQECKHYAPIGIGWQPDIFEATYDEAKP